MDKDSKKIIGEKLKELRKSHGFKQVDVAGATDIKQSTYSQYEAGIRAPSNVVLYRLASFYGISTDDLLKLCINLDDDVYFEARPHSDAGLEESEFLKFSGKKEYAKLSRDETELLFYFSRLMDGDRQEVLDFADYKYRYKRDGGRSETRKDKSEKK